MDNERSIQYINTEYKTSTTKITWKASKLVGDGREIDMSLTDRLNRENEMITDY